MKKKTLALLFKHAHADPDPERSSPTSSSPQDLHAEASDKLEHDNDSLKRISAGDRDTADLIDLYHRRLKKKALLHLLHPDVPFAEADDPEAHLAHDRMLEDILDGLDDDVETGDLTQMLQALELDPDRDDSYCFGAKIETEMDLLKNAQVCY